MPPSAGVAPNAALPIGQAAESPFEAEFNWVHQWVHEWIDVMRATRGWVQYGIVGFAILCIVIGAVEALFGR